MIDIGDDINKDDINSPVWGVFAGAGLDIWILFVDVSYELSVPDVQTSFTNIDFGKTNGYLRMLELELGCSFDRRLWMLRDNNLLGIRLFRYF
ncbi:MAG: hypothetical protein ACI9UV_001550 [Algoriphagus sp.]